MRRLRQLRPLLLLFPLLLGWVAALALQARGEANPVYHFQFRADLGTTLLVGGAALSVLLAFGWAARWYHARQLLRTTAGERQAALQNRRSFLGRLDHELKNPLTALRAELAFLADSDLPAGAAPVLGDMSAQVDRLSRLINDLRKLAQLEDQAIERQPVQVGELLAEVVEAAQDHPDYPERQVRLTLLQRPWALPPVAGDRGLLWLACYNLLDNALKFTSPGAEVEVRAFETDAWLSVEVADTGPGIPEADLPHIFEELYRGTNARGYPGSGLGLALVRAVVALHGGTIAARSRPGQGTVFTMHLPTAG